MENKDIRFIDSKYNELFRIKDGESITVTFSDGSMSDRKCTYIDDYHTQIGYNVFHICEFAELMERGGSVYRPKDTPMYELEKIEQSEFEYVFAPSKDETLNRGCICYIRGYFDNSVYERFQTEAMVENTENYKVYKTPDFSLECDNVINYLRHQADKPIFKSRVTMHNAAYDLKAERLASDKDICGYKVTTDKNVYYIRCDARKNTYNAYIYCYDKQALQTYKDLKFVEQNYDAVDKDKFFKTTNGVMEMYYNPDANAGGQIVELTISKDDINDAAKLYKNPQDFFSHLEGMAKGVLYDVGTETFKEMAEYLMENKGDFEGCTLKTMNGLKKYAAPEKAKNEQDIER